MASTRELKELYYEGDDLFTRDYIVTMEKMDSSFWQLYEFALEESDGLDRRK